MLGKKMIKFSSFLMDQQCPAIIHPHHTPTNKKPANSRACAPCQPKNPEVKEIFACV